MADYWVYSGAAGTNDGSSWTNAFTAWDVAACITAMATAGNRFFVADDHVDAGDGAAKTHVWPASGLPNVVISADRADAGAVPAYKVGTTVQFNTTDGAYVLTQDGSVAFYGVTMASGSHVVIASDPNESSHCIACTFKPGNAAYVSFAAGGTSRSIIHDCITDLSSDSGATVVNALQCGNGVVEISRMTFVSPTNRTGVVFSPPAGANRVSGCDFSGFTSATLCELSFMAGQATYSNCILSAAQAAVPVSLASAQSQGEITLFNCGEADAPGGLWHQTYFGRCSSSPVVYRTGGAAIEAEAVSWSIVTTALCSEHAPFYTPWRYGTTTAGTKTFDVYITHDADTTYNADFTDAEVWLEVEYLSTSDEPITALASDHRATITTTAAAQTDDTTSSWNGAGPSFTYQQQLSVSATVGEAGVYRARVAVGAGSIGTGHNFYIDPKVTVS